MSVTPFSDAEQLSRKHTFNLLSSGKREDGRDLSTYREVKVEEGFVEKSHGSAIVSIGETRVLVAVRVETGVPFPDTPDEGMLNVNAELVPFARPEFQSGPPNENTIELARLVDRGLRGAKTIDLSKLCIESGKKALAVYIDIYALNNDGNMVDAATLATMKALKKTVIPKTQGFSDAPKPLEVGSLPVSVSLIKVNDKLIADPSLLEEEIAQVKISACIDKEGNVCSLQKSEVGSIPVPKMKEAIRLAIEESKGLLKVLE